MIEISLRESLLLANPKGLKNQTRERFDPELCSRYT